MKTIYNLQLGFHFFLIFILLRYYELKEKDVLKFGFSTREYVLLHERSEGVVDNDT